MQGIAQKIFLERSLKLHSPENKRVSKDRKIVQWPFLEEMIRKHYLGYVDLYLAQHLLHDMGIEAEEVAALICHLSMASRQGHGCVKIEKKTFDSNDEIKPSPSEIWINYDSENREGLSLEEVDYLKELIFKGSEKITAPLMRDVAQNPLMTYTPILKNQSSYYFQRYWELESSFLDSLDHLVLESQKLFPFDSKRLGSDIESLVEQGELLPEQGDAILKSIESPLMLITGGPGTGKTYTAGILLCTLWKSMSNEQRLNFKVALAAPTGKAAANLEASLKNAFRGQKDSPVMKAQTLHQLLGIKRGTSQKKMSMLSADLILIDESSMIDLNVMTRLFTALKPGARLILIGDKHQLPPIEVGSLFADLISYFLVNRNCRVQVIELKKCLRTELRSIVHLAEQINQGNDLEVLKLLEIPTEGISLVKLEENLVSYEQQKQLISYAVSRFPYIKNIPEDPIALLKEFSHFRILTPLRKGMFGVDTLNALIFQGMQMKMGKTENVIIPIIVTQNDYSRALFNGEAGLLVKDKGSEFALFPSRELDGRPRKIPLLLMPRFEYAYCLSIHKSQGSEFDHVLLVLPEGAEVFGRQALYTGVTRAKRQLEIWSRPQALSQMMKKKGERQSGMRERLRKN